MNRAGKLLRDIDIDPSVLQDMAKVDESFAIVQRFRDLHGYPMQKVRGGLVSFVNTNALEAAVSQRHKRVPRILRKLRRSRDSPSGGTHLGRLEDIGGCRVVLESEIDLLILENHIQRVWGESITRQRDYVAAPKPMGYRAKHIVVWRDDCAIEIQLRTRGQQQWADAVEKIDGRLKFNLKDEDGPDDLKAYFHLAAEVIYHRETGLLLTKELRTDFEAARQDVIRAGYYTG